MIIIKHKDVAECIENIKNFKELEVEDLVNGYIKQDEENVYICVFCGEVFEEGVIYVSRDRMVTAQKAITEHINDEHESVFENLISLDKQINGLSDTQKKILSAMYEKKDPKVISEEMGISPATVRTHKFNLQKMKREAKIFIALMKMIENEHDLTEIKKIDENIKEETVQVKEPDMFSLNSLNPFFKQIKYK